MRKIKTDSNAAEFTVSEISGALRKTIEETYGNVRVRGEISGYRGIHGSGHAYFALKDAGARLEAVIWRTALQELRFPPEEGLEVIASGRLSSYAGSSKYQIIIDNLEPAGAGALMALLEQRRKKLAEEGLFDESRKKPLPFMPKIIGIVTSPTGAVIRDILHRVEERFPLHIIVWPARMQGETAPAEVTAAIRGFNALPHNPPHGKNAIPRPDMLIIARGGGSLEDLWGFNDERVVRAAAESDLPIISAIGHETDWTLLDYAADKRAPTPTAAAELAVPVKAEIAAALAALHKRFTQARQRLLQQKRQNLQHITARFPDLNNLLEEPKRRLREDSLRFRRALSQLMQHKRTVFSGTARQLSPYLITRIKAEKKRTLLYLAARLDRSFTHITQSRAHRLENLAKLLHNLSSERILERGFVLVLDKDSKPVRRARAVQTGDALSLRFADGAVSVAATSQSDKIPAENFARNIDPQQQMLQKKAAKPQKKSKSKPQKPASEQGDLF